MAKTIANLTNEEMMIITEGYRRGESINELLNNGNEVINHQGRQLISTRMDGDKKLFTSVPLKQKDFSDILSVVEFLKANEKNADTEITVKGIYLSIQGYRADGGLRYDPTDKEKSKYKFSVKLEAYQGGESATINFHIDKSSKDIAGDIVKKIKEQGAKKSLTGFTKDNKVELQSGVIRARDFWKQ